MSDYVVGIDVSSSKVCGVVGKLNSDNEIQIVGITTSDYSGIKEDVQFDEQDISYVIHGVVSRLEEIVGLPLKKTYISVPVSVCEVVKTKGVVSFPEMKEISEEDVKNVCEVAKFSVGDKKDIIQVDIIEYSVDDMHNIDNPIGMKGKLLQSDGNAFILSNKYINIYTKCFEKIGLEIEGWVVNSIGISKDLPDSDEMNDGVAIIDAGSSQIEVSVFTNKDFVDCISVPFGGRTITNDISICLKLSQADSERLKVKCNTLLKENLRESNRLKVNAQDGKTVDVNYGLLVDVINARVVELLEIIHRKLQEEGLDKQVKSYIIVGGGLALFRDITIVAEDILKKPVRIGVPDYVGAANPIYATATGIVSNVLKQEQKFSCKRNELDEQQHDDQDNVKKDSKIKTIIKEFLKSFSNEEEIK